MSIWDSIKAFFSLQLRARRTAIALDDCLRELGQMRHVPDDQSVMSMRIDKRAELIRRGYWHCLPKFRWRG